MPRQRQFFGDVHSAAAYEAALLVLHGARRALVEIDMEPFYRAARLLYEGPWVAERYIAARSVIEIGAASHAPRHAADHPRRRAFQRGRCVCGLLSRSQELRRACERAFRRIDALALPTIPRAYTVDEVLADPIELNSRLGTYTNFVNLFDLCALAVPAAILPDGIPFGVTLIGRAGDDAAHCRNRQPLPRRD